MSEDVAKSDGLLRLGMRVFLLNFAPLTILAAGAFGFIYLSQLDSQLGILENANTQDVIRQRETIDHYLSSVYSDVRLLSSHTALFRYVETGDPAARRELAEEYLSFVDVSGLYDQVRVLDETGMEVVRVDYNDGSPAIVPDEKLQYKGDRYYFTEAFRSDDGEMYASPFDLNVERGEIERPLKPVIRIGVPISDAAGRRGGVVLANYIGSHLLEDLRGFPSESSGKRMLLNSAGYWLRGSPKDEDSWGFMFEERADRTFANAFPLAWKQISARVSGQFVTPEGMFTFEAVSPQQFLRDGWAGAPVPMKSDGGSREPSKGDRWTIVSFVSTDVLRAQAKGLWVPNLMSFGLLELIISGGCCVQAWLMLGRRRAEAKARASDDRNRELLNSIGAVLIVLASDEFRVTHWNPVADATLGVSSHQVIGVGIEECEIPWDKTRVLEALARCRREGRTQRIEELAYDRQGGQKGFLGTTLRPISAAAGTAPDILLMAKDVTERRVLEGQLVQAQKLESIGQLAAGIAHEINTPSQYVGDNLEFLEQSFGELGDLLKKYRALQAAAEAGSVPPELISEVTHAAEAADIEFLEEEIPRALTQSREGIGRVTKIVRAMKEFSHPGSAEKRPIDLNRAVESTLTVAANEWKYVAEIETDFDEELPPVPCLAGEFNQVVLNIVVNAAQAIAEAQPEDGGEKGKLRISTRREGDDWAVLEISDSGPGMPAEVRDKVFDPFFTTKEVGKGTGQGLAIARSVVVDKHGGTIGVESEVGQGTTFRIRLPLRSDADDTEAGSEEGQE